MTLDLDRFKEYNDGHGHQAGDRLLQESAAAWRAVLRRYDTLCRYGGEEFGEPFGGAAVGGSLDNAPLASDPRQTEPDRDAEPDEHDRDS